MKSLLSKGTLTEILNEIDDKDLLNMSISKIDQMNEIVNEILNNIFHYNSLSVSRLDYKFTGDYFLQTDVLNMTPLYIFVPIKTSKENILINEKIKRVSKSASKFMGISSSGISDLEMANAFFSYLSEYLDSDSKFFIRNNIIKITVSNILPVRIIFGYSYSSSQISYNYFGKMYTTDLEKEYGLLNDFFEGNPELKKIAQILKYLELFYFENINTRNKYPRSLNSLFFIENLLANIPEDRKSDDLNEYTNNVLIYLKNVDIYALEKISGEKMFNENDSNKTYNKKKLGRLISNISTSIEYIESVNAIMSKIGKKRRGS